MRGWWFATIAALVGCDQVFGLERDPLAPGDWRSVTAGDRHTCAIRLDGTLWCWGANDLSQLGLPSIEETSPTQVGDARWASVSTRDNSTCGIQDDGSLWCWGPNRDAQLGVGDDIDRKEPTRVAGGPWVTVEIGIVHACAIHVDTTLWCWGYNDDGQVGTGTTTRGLQMPPTRLPGAGWRSITLARNHTCGVQADNTLWCWGDNSYGNLADPNGASREVPYLAPGSWVAVAAGGIHTCALSTTGHLRCWGTNDSGQLGNGTTSVAQIGTTVGGDASDWVDVVSGLSHVCGVRKNGSLHCWGDNTRGQVPSPEVGVVASIPTAIPVSAPDSASELTATWTQLALGSAHTCAIDDGHRLWCAGASGSGQLGRGLPSHREPRRVPGVWTDLGAGTLSTCALDAASEASCWGNNDESQLGEPAGQTRQVPTSVDAVGPWEDLTVGANFACVRSGTGRICWGQNNLGQIGDATMTRVFLPKKLDDGFWPTTASYHSCGIDQDQMYCWGNNEFGELGFGGLSQMNQPTEVARTVVATWSAVSAGGNHTCAIGSAGLYCWGRNDAGQLGNGGSIETLIPLQSSPAIFESIASGLHTNCAIASGVASCWGDDRRGQLGLGTGDIVLRPTVLPGNWKQLALSEDFTCGIASDDSLWCWGFNDRGQLGIGNAGDVDAPTRVGTDTDWARVKTGEAHACALKTDRSLWCWGQNDHGEVGDGTAWFDRLALVP